MKDNEQTDKKLNRALISMLAFITVAVFLCLYFSITLYADENINLATKYDISSMLSVSDYPQYETSNGRVLFLYSPDTDRNRNLSFLNNNQLVISSSSNYLFDSDYYYWNNQGVYGVPNGSFVVVNPNDIGSMLYFNASDYTTSTPYSYLMTTSNTPSIGSMQITNNNRVNVDGVSMLRFGGVDTNYCLYNTNLPVYVTDSSITNVTSVEGLEQINPNYSSDESENASNNLVFDNPDFYFSNTNYTAPYDVSINTFSVIPNGYVSFSFDLNDYQLAHPEEFNLHIDYIFKLRFQYTNTGSAFGPFESTSSLLSDGKRNYMGVYTLNTQIDLDDYLDIGNKKTFDYLFNNLIGTDNYSLTGILTQVKELSSVSYSNFELYCTAYLTDDNSGKGGNYTEWYNPMSKKGYTTDVSGTRNNNPYISGDYNNSESSNISGAPGVAGNEGSYNSDSSGMYNPYLPSNTSNYNSSIGGSSSATGGSPSVNVNTGAVNVNTSQDPKAVVDYVKGELVPTGDAVGFVDKLTTVTESNNFVSYMSSTFSFLPSTFWSNLSVYFEIFLGILVGFFVLRLILDLL